MDVVSPACGVSIADVDLSRPLTPEARHRIIAALLAYHVVVFPGQALSREEQFAFAANFGEVEAHGGHRVGAKRHGVAHVLSNLDEDGNPTLRRSPAANYHWHTDKPYRQTPPMLTMLHAVEVPPRGGDTEFANTVLAYDALAEAEKRRIAALRVVFRPAFDPLGAAIDHPLVRTHPDTGREALYLGNHAVGVKDMPEPEGAALLRDLLEHATQRRFVYAHHWRLGDLVMWDNRCLLHRLVADENLCRYRRVLHRSVVRGTVPI